MKSLNESMASVLNNTRRWAVLCGDSLDVMRQLPDACVNAVFTSPPYYLLRDYGTGRWEGGDSSCSHRPSKRQNLDKLGKIWSGDGHKHSATIAPCTSYGEVCPRCAAKRIDKQIGLESLHDCSGWATGQRCGVCFVCRLTAVFREVRRVLHPSGICVVNLGDSYSNDTKWGGNGSGPDTKNYTSGKGGYVGQKAKRKTGLPPKSLMGIPWRFALSMQADGWILRNDAIWPKMSPMPASVTDRLHVAHEYLFVFAKRPHYFWDSFAVRQPSASTTLARDKYTRITTGKDGHYAVAHDHETISDSAGRHWRTNDVWLAGLNVTIADVEDYLRHLKDKREGRGMLTDGDGEPLAIRVASEGYGGEHYAVFPSLMVRGFLLAGASQRGACSVCSAPYERLTEKGSPIDTGGGRRKHVAQKPGQGINGALQTGVHYGRREIGWHPTCQHADAETFPALVLDCFGGSGTAGVVAEQLGLRSICIDLSADHCRQAEARIATALRTDELKRVRKDEDEPNLFAGLETNQ